MWQPLFQALQFRPEDDVLFRSRGIEERRFGIQAKVVYIAEYGHNRRDPAAGCDENNALVLVFVEAEPPERSACLDGKSHRTALVEKRGHNALRLFLHRDFEKPGLRWRRRDRIRPGKFAAVNKPVECKKLTRSGPERAHPLKTKPKADTIVRLPFGSRQLKNNRLIGLLNKRRRRLFRGHRDSGLRPAPDERYDDS